MSSSMVTYASISFDSDLPPWGFHLISDAEPQSPEYLAPSNDEIPVKDQHLPADALPTARSPGYVADSDPLEEDPEEDPTDYPADKGYDDEEEEESSKNDDDEEEEKEASEEDDEEEEHLAPADSTLPAIDSVLSVEETEPFETDESAATPPPPPAISPRIVIPLSSTRLRRARIYVQPYTPPSPSTKALILDPTYARAPLSYRAAIVQLRAASPSTYHPLLP
ncbi:hypothetical protein Tco_0446701 [Tanacetum coccineum]